MPAFTRAQSHLGSGKSPDSGAHDDRHRRQEATRGTGGAGTGHRWRHHRGRHRLHGQPVHRGPGRATRAGCARGSPAPRPAVRSCARRGCRCSTSTSSTGLDLYIDGADEANPARQLIKGGGGALTREKIVAAASRRFVCIVDETKLVATLGKFPLPVEVIPMARELVARELARRGGRPVWRSDCVTDNGNHILDVHGLAHHRSRRARSRAQPDHRRRDRGPVRRPAGGCTAGRHRRRGRNPLAHRRCPAGGPAWRLRVPAPTGGIPLY